LSLPFFPFLHLLATATGPVFELAGMASEPPTKAASKQARAILLINSDTEIDSTAAGSSQVLGGPLDRFPVLTIDE
jgi:hypothetical protein